MSPTLHEVKFDPSKAANTSPERKILSKAEAQNRDSENCWLINDTNTTYVVFMLHDNGWLAELWGHPPGMTIAITPTWKVYIDPPTGGDDVTGTTDGSQDYWCHWKLTTEAGKSFYFSTMSFE